MAVSLFNAAVPLAERTALAAKIFERAATGDLETCKPTLPSLTPTSTIISFVGPRSRLLFDLLIVPLDFLVADNWSERLDYCTIKAALRNLSPINDSAERALSMATVLNTHTSQEMRSPTRSCCKW